MKKVKPKTNLKITFGAPIFMLQWGTMNFIITTTCFLNILGGIFCLVLIYAAYYTKITIGDYLNMVSKI